jgi:hypothetical protein
MKQGAVRGIFERPPASGIWWISYFDAVGKWHREKVGRRAVALDAYYQRKREIREGKFVPPAARRSRMTFRDLCTRALAHKKTRVSASHAMNDELRAKKILASIGDLGAGGIERSRDSRFSPAGSGLRMRSRVFLARGSEKRERIAYRRGSLQMHEFSMPDQRPRDHR